MHSELVGNHIPRVLASIHRKKCTLKKTLRLVNLNLSYKWVLNLNSQYIYESSLYFILVFDANYNTSQCRTPVVASETNNCYFPSCWSAPEGMVIHCATVRSCPAIASFLLLRTAANIMIRLHSAALWWSVSSWKGEKLSNVLLLNYKCPLVVWSLCSAPPPPFPEAAQKLPVVFVATKMTLVSFHFVAE